MPKCSCRGVIVFLMCMLLLLCSQGTSYGNRIRKPVVVGHFYPDSESELKQTIQNFSQKAANTVFNAPQGKSLKALIMPHAGYIYSGLTAAHASLVLKEKKFSKVILMGPDHRIGFLNCAVSDVDAYQTPLGIVPLHEDAKKIRMRSKLFASVPFSDKKEHSLEVILPFLQYYIGPFDLVPIVMGNLSGVDDVALEISTIIDNGTLIVVSTDLSHYLPYPQAKDVDQETIRFILNLEDKKLFNRQNAACGIMPVLVLIKIAQKRGWKPVVVHYANSGDTAGNKNTVVGYATIAFYGDRGL